MHSSKGATISHRKDGHLLVQDVNARPRALWKKPKSPRRWVHLRGLEDLRATQEKRSHQRPGCDQIDPREQDERGSNPRCVSEGSLLGPELRQGVPRSRELEKDPLRDHHPTFVK